MKVPRKKELSKLQKQLGSGGMSLYRRILRIVVPQWSAISGTTDLEEAITSWNVPRMLELAGALVSVDHDTATKHFVAHQMAALIRKYPWSPKETGLDPEKTAISSFKSAEHRNLRTNQWFRAWNARTGKPRPYADAFERMDRFIRYVVGTTPDLGRIYRKCDFTAGASIGVHGDATNLRRKLQAESWTVTPTARPYVAAALDYHWHYAERFAQSNGVVRSLEPISKSGFASSCRLVDYNIIEFVPKTADTHRSIAVEPLGNGFIQKGIDVDWRDCLRRVGLDLSDQTPNQRMAWEGSFNGEDDFVTIDVKDSSNSMSLMLVKSRLPPDWFMLMDRVRSPSYRLPSGEVRRYEMFVSMGNGFCFPLQTLLFASMVHACSPQAVPGKDFRVYGDDIVVRKGIARDVLDLLRVCGFRPNLKKTKMDGFFRESCGANWYKGEDVTPMTLKYDLKSLEGCFKFLNLARRNERTSLFFEDAMPAVIARIPDPFLFWRPFRGRPETGIDPAGLEFTPRWDRHSAWQCPVWLELHTRSVEDRVEEPTPGWVVMAAALRGHPSSMPFALRRRVATRVVRVASAVPELPERAPPILEFSVWDGRRRRTECAAPWHKAAREARQPDLRDYRLLRR